MPETILGTNGGRVQLLKTTSVGYIHLRVGVFKMTREQAVTFLDRFSGSLDSLFLRFVNADKGGGRYALEAETKETPIEGLIDLLQLPAVRWVVEELTIQELKE